MSLQTETEKEKFLKKRFKKRWRETIVDKANKYDLDIPDKEKLWRKVLNIYRNNWFCPYCGQKLKIKDSEKPYYQSFSIDHKKSADIGGTNKLSNLTICCHRCNLVKGTMTAKTFKKMLNYEKPLLSNRKLLNQIFYEMWRGQLANKLDREDNRK